MSLSFFCIVLANAQTLVESNLPIIIITTNGVDMVDEPKRHDSMKILDSESGINRNIGTAAVYEGKTGIELRGSLIISLS